MSEASIGAILREARERKGISEEELYERTRILPQYIRYLEEDKLDFLPEPYVRGFIRTLCAALEIDAGPLLSQVSALLHPLDQQVAAEGQPEQGTQGSRRTIHAGDVLAAILILGVLGGLAFAYLRFREKWTVPKAGLIQEIPLEKGIEAEAAGAPQGAGEQAPAPVGSERVRLAVRSTDSCWVRIVADDSTEYELLLPPGGQRQFEATSNFYLKCGNAGGLVVTVNDREIGPLGKRGEVTEIWIDRNGEVRRRTEAPKPQTAP
ncbi:MAG: DUF4115 domain-containing protein [candidate division KSB1 bacterium]|nr:DUF4115 domain-containing protein [candidate division KSB1 bacterium]